LIFSRAATTDRKTHCSKNALIKKRIVQKTHWSKNALIEKRIDQKTRWSKNALIRRLQNRGGCYDHNFRRFSPIFGDFRTIFGEQMEFFLATNVRIQIFPNLALFCAKRQFFLAAFFGENILKIHNIGPRSNLHFVRQRRQTERAWVRRQRRWKATHHCSEANTNKSFKTTGYARWLYTAWRLVGHGNGWI
jgi:hypothetical protein